MPEDRSILTRSAPPPDEIVACGGEAEQVADVRFGRSPAIPRPLVVLIHGGFWRPTIDRTHTGPMAGALAEAGWTVAAVEYRRVPGDPNVTIGDVALALQRLPAKVSGHDGRVLVVGHSAGGHLALWAASKRPTPLLRGALALAPAADLQRAHEMDLGDGATLAFLGEAPGRRTDLDPARMPSPAVATTIVHGDVDDVVPCEVSESYVAAHPQVRLVKVRGAGHFGPIDPLGAVWPTILEELARLAQ